MVEMVDCTTCYGEGWLAHDMQCPDCGGTGEIMYDDLPDSDRLYDERKDDLLTNPEWLD
jgi:RecJ-like exonuclease